MRVEDLPCDCWCCDPDDDDLIDDAVAEVEAALERILESVAEVERISRTRYSRWGAFVCWVKGSHPVPDAPTTGYGKVRCSRCGDTLEGIWLRHARRNANEI